MTNINTFQGNVEIAGAITLADQVLYPQKRWEIDLTSGTETARFYPIYFNSNFGTFGDEGVLWPINFKVFGVSLGASDSFNDETLIGYARGGGYSDHQGLCKVHSKRYTATETRFQGIWRGTSAAYGFVIYMRGGYKYSILTDAVTVVENKAAYTVNNSVWAVKNAAGSDVVGTSANIGQMIDMDDFPQTGEVTATTGSVLINEDLYIPQYIKHIGDENNLFGFSDTDTFKIATAATNRLIVKSDGKIGIGKDDPSTKLHIGSGDVGIDRDQKFDFGAGYSSNWYIKQKSADNKIYFERTGGSANSLVIDTSGNVGIGTATPRNRNPGGGEPGLNIYTGRLQVGATEASFNTAVIGGGGPTSRVARNNYLNVNLDFQFPRGFSIVSFGYINFHDSNIVTTQAMNVCSGNGPYRQQIAGSLSYIQISTLSSSVLRFRGVNLPSNYNDWALNHWFSGYVY